MGENKRRNRGFFIKVTREKAMKEIRKEQQRQGRKLDIEERREIARKVARKARTQTAVFAMAGFLGIGALASGGTKALPEGKETTKTQTENSIELEEIKTQQEKFREEIKVISEDEIIKQEISELESEKDVLAYLKNMYLEEYEQKTGKADLTTSDIKIFGSSQTYTYVLDGGQVVTHGETPLETEKQIKADGKSYTTQQGGYIYSVRLAKNNEVIDCMTSGSKRAIPGDKYNEMKDSESILTDMGGITQIAFKLMSLFEELDRKSGNDFIESKCEDAKSDLADAVIKYKQNQEKDTNIIEQNQTQENNDREM